jgi:hypothetical protein
MDLEHLTKKQTILLTLLVSFVTSIATGIVSVSLMAQMPPPVTQTINRVVERTLERVVEKKTDAAGNVTTKEKTVVVKETDLISKAVQSALPSLVAVYSKSKPVADAAAPANLTPSSSAQAGSTLTATAAASDALAQSAQTEGSIEGAEATKADTATIRRFLSRGVFISDSVLVTDAAVLGDLDTATAAHLEIVNLASGATLTATSVTVSKGVARITVPKQSGSPVRISSAQAVQLGNTLVMLAGESRVQVATGIVSNLERDDKKRIISLTVDGISPQPGAILVDLEGSMLAQYIGGAWMLQ